MSWTPPMNVPMAIVTAVVLFPLYLFIIRDLRKVSYRLFLVAFFSLMIKFINAIFVQKIIYGGIYASGDTHYYAYLGVEYLKALQADPSKYLYHFLFHMPVGTEHMYTLTGILYTFIQIPSLEALAVIAAFLSSLASYIFLSAYRLAFPGLPCKKFGYMIFLFPSLLFWTSLHLKEPWLYFYLSVATYGASLLLNRKILRGLIFLGLGCFMGFHIKPHILLFFVTALTFLILGLNTKRNIIFYLLKIILFFGIIFASTQVYTLVEQKFVGEADVLDRLAHLKEAAAYGGSAAGTMPIASLSDLKYLPYNMFTVLLRPAIWEARGLMPLLSAAENLFFMWMILICWKNSGGKKNAFYYFCLFYILIFAVGFSFQVGNLGTMVRQKVHIFPFWFALISYHLSQKTRKKIVFSPHPFSRVSP